MAPNTMRLPEAPDVGDALADCDGDIRIAGTRHMTRRHDDRHAWVIGIVGAAGVAETPKQQPTAEPA